MKQMQTQNLLLESLDDLGRSDVLWQAGVLVASVALAWLVSYLLKPRHTDSSGWAAIKQGSFSRALFPLSAYVFVSLGVALLNEFFHVRVLKLAGPLFLAMAGIRVAVYMLRHVFPNAEWVRKSERYIAALIWGALFLHLTGLLPELRQTLDDIGFDIGKSRISLWLVLTGALSFAGTVMLSMWLGSFVEQRVMQAKDLDLSLRVVFTKIIRAVLLVVGVLIALPLVGIDVSMLSVFGGAFGVGLGLGLQKIASNYVSGFVILLDRSIRLGDLVQVDNRMGEIAKLTSRYVVVRGADGSEAIIPNETLVTSTVLNLSYTDRNMRVALPVQVSYRSDLDQVRRVLLQAVEGNPRSLLQPAPNVLIKGFGESGIDLELAVWLGDPQNGVAQFRSDINAAIWDGFRREGIEIPYPQREVNVLNHGNISTQSERV